MDYDKILYQFKSLNLSDELIKNLNNVLESSDERYITLT